MTERRTLDSSEKLLAILSYLIQSGGAGVSETARETSIAKSTVHVHLQSLRETGHVVKRGSSYEPSIRLFEWGQSVRDSNEIFQQGRQEVDSLARKTNGRVNLGVFEAESLRVTYSEEATGSGSTESHSPAESREFTAEALKESAFDPDDRLGTELDFHATAMGKTVLANLPEERAASLLDRQEFTSYTDNTIQDRETLLDELATVRNRGYAVDDEERNEDVSCIAAAIVHEGDPVGSVSITVPANRLNSEYRQQLGDQVVQTTNLITIRLTHA